MPLYNTKFDNVVNMTKLNSMKYVSKGDSLRKSGQYKESLSCYLRSLMMERNNSASYLGLGMSYKFLNDYAFLALVRFSYRKYIFIL